MTAYATTALDPATVGLSRLRAGLLTGPGPAGFDALAAALRRAADASREVAGDLDAVLRRDAVVHAGPAADGARAHLSAVRHDTAGVAGRLDRAARAAAELAGHHATARRDVAPAPEAPTSASAALLDAVLDTGGDERARLAVATYQARCNAVLSGTLPEFGV